MKTGDRRAGKAVRSPRLPDAPVAKTTAETTTALALSTAEDCAFAIVGVGASAGGLEAFTELLSHLPEDSGMAFVLIQHLDPSHESHLTELLSRVSKMPVCEVKGETRARANRVYVIPP